MLNQLFYFISFTSFLVRQSECLQLCSDWSLWFYLINICLDLNCQNLFVCDQVSLYFLVKNIKNKILIVQIQLISLNITRQACNILAHQCFLTL